MASNVIRDRHNLQRNLKLNGNWISYDGDSEGIFVGITGHVLISSTGTSTALIIKESSETPSEVGVAQFGHLWVKNAVPNDLYFTNDAGNEIQITSGAELSAGTISLPADQISLGDGEIVIGNSTDEEDNIIFKQNSTEWLTFNTSDVSDQGNTPVSEILGKSNQRLRIRSDGVQQNFQLFAGNSLQLAHMIQDEDYEDQGTSIHRWRNNEGFYFACSYENDPTIEHDDDGGRIHQGMHVYGFGIPDNSIVGEVTNNEEFELAHEEYPYPAVSTTDGDLTEELEFRETSYITPTVYLKNLQAPFKENQDWQDHTQVAGQSAIGMPAQFRGSTSGLKCVIRMKTDSDGIPSVHGNLVNGGNGYTNYITVKGAEYNNESLIDIPLFLD